MEMEMKRIVAQKNFPGWRGVAESTSITIEREGSRLKGRKKKGVDSVVEKQHPCAEERTKLSADLYGERDPS